MGLIYCSKCGKQISDKAKVCPNCGAPRGKHPLGNFFDSWNTLLPNEKTSIKKSLIYTLISVSLMLIFLYAPVWFGLLRLFGAIDSPAAVDWFPNDEFTDYLYELLGFKGAIWFTGLWGLWWWLLFVSIIETYKRSALIVQNPLKYKIGIGRGIVFSVMGVILSIYSINAFISAIISAIKDVSIWVIVYILAVFLIVVMVIHGTYKELVGIRHGCMKLYAKECDDEDFFPYAPWHEEKSKP